MRAVRRTPPNLDFEQARWESFGRELCFATTVNAFDAVLIEVTDFPVFRGRGRISSVMSEAQIRSSAVAVSARRRSPGLRNDCVSGIC